VAIRDDGYVFSGSGFSFFVDPDARIVVEALFDEDDHLVSVWVKPAQKTETGWSWRVFAQETIDAAFSEDVEPWDLLGEASSS
jgi:hypothetical protein